MNGGTRQQTWEDDRKTEAARPLSRPSELRLERLESLQRTADTSSSETTPLLARPCHYVIFELSESQQRTSAKTWTSNISQTHLYEFMSCAS